MALSTLRLEEFLLARISEDEAVIREPQFVALAEPIDREQLLAECEAKRRIVAMHVANPFLEHFEYDCTCGFRDHRLSRCSCGAVLRSEGGGYYDETGQCPTLAALAAVYADHEDFREEWRHDADPSAAAPVDYEWHNVWYENMKEAPAQPEG